MKSWWYIPVFLCCFSEKIVAQTDTVRLLNPARKTSSVVPKRPPQAIYFQLGGTGFLFSVIYDRRFGKRLNGAGFAAGLGYYSGGGASAYTYPVSINYLFGKRHHFAEIAGGATYTRGRIDFGDIDVSGNYFYYHLNGGYRYQRPTGGFFFRGGVSPLFFPDNQYMLSYYLGFGYSF